MRILYVTTVGLTMIFFKHLIRQLVDEGNIVDIATNENEYQVDDFYRDLGCNIYQVDFSRSPASKKNLKAYRQLKEIVHANSYDLVHCHTPVAGVVTRLACRTLRKQGLRVFYTAHGFHFYKGAPLANWLVYYPIEKICARFTDTLVTINHEDYEFAVKKMKISKIVQIPGVGIDVEKFKNTVIDKEAKRRELGIPEDAVLLVSVGELNENKNHSIVIKALNKVNNKNIHYMIAGRGHLEEYLNILADEAGISEQVHILGYRNDVQELYKAADIDVFPSIREGLGLAAVEGMAAGLPLICSDNRGTREYAINCRNSIVCPNGSVSEYCDAIAFLAKRENREQYGEKATETAKKFSVETSSSIIKNLYFGREI